MKRRVQRAKVKKKIIQRIRALILITGHRQRLMIKQIKTLQVAPDLKIHSQIKILDPINLLTSRLKGMKREIDLKLYETLLNPRPLIPAKPISYQTFIMAPSVSKTNKSKSKRSKNIMPIRITLGYLLKETLAEVSPYSFKRHKTLQTFLWVRRKRI